MRHLIAIFILAAGTVAAQTKEQTRDVEHVKYSAFWSTAAGYRSTLVVFNSSQKERLTVRTLFTPTSGNGVSLSPLSLEPLASQTIDLNERLAAAGLAPTNGTATFTYGGTYRNVLHVETMVETPWWEAAFTIPSNETGLSGLMETAFYLPTESTELFVSVQNTSPGPVAIRPTLYLERQSFDLAPLSIPAGGAVAVTLDGNTQSLFRSAWRDGTAGGLKLLCDGSTGCSVNATGWLVDKVNEVGSMISLSDPTKYFTADLLGTQLLPNASVRQVLAAGTFVPRLVVRNTSDLPQTLEMQHRSEIGQPGARTYSLLPFEVRLVNLQSEFDGAVTERSSVKLTCACPPGTIVGRSFSAASGGAILYSSLEQASYPIYNGVLWAVDSVRDTFLSITNVSELPDEVTVTLYNSGQKFELNELRFDGNETKSLTLRQLLPPSTWGSGGFRVAGRDSASKLLVKEQVVDLAGRVIAPLYGGPPYVTDFFMDQNYHELSAGGSTVFYCKLGWSDWSETLNTCGTVSHTNTTDFSLSGSGSSRSISGGAAGKQTFITAQSHYTDPQVGLVPVQAQGEALTKIKCSISQILTETVATPPAATTTICKGTDQACWGPPPPELFNTLVANVQVSCGSYSSGSYGPVNVTLGIAGATPSTNMLSLHPLNGSVSPPPDGMFRVVSSTVTVPASAVAGSVIVKADLIFPAGSNTEAISAAAAHKEHTVSITVK